MDFPGPIFLKGYKEGFKMVETLDFIFKSIGKSSESRFLERDSLILLPLP